MDKIKTLIIHKTYYLRRQLKYTWQIIIIYIYEQSFITRKKKVRKLKIVLPCTSGTGIFIGNWKKGTEQATFGIK